MEQRTKETLKTAVEEIRWLRHQNELLAAKVDTMELFALVLRTRPEYAPRGEGVDIAHELERIIEGPIVESSNAPPEPGAGEE